MEYEDFIQSFNAEYEMPTNSDGIKICVEKLGGGTIGKKYHGDWAYVVYEDGDPVSWGNDLRTGTEKTHDEAAIAILDIWQGN